MKHFLRPRIAPLLDREACLRVAREATSRSQQKAGVYCILGGLHPLGAINATRELLRGAARPFYIGGTADLPVRMGQLANGLSGVKNRHGAADKLTSAQFAEWVPADCALIVIPSRFHDSLEWFLLREHARLFGVYPPGNERPGGATPARNRPPWIQWQWSMLGIGSPLSD